MPAVWLAVPAGVGFGDGEAEFFEFGDELAQAAVVVEPGAVLGKLVVGPHSRQTVYAVTSLTSADATAEDLAHLVREHWPIEAHHHTRDMTFSEDTATSRTGRGPANLATILAAIKDAGYLHIPEGRRDHTTLAETLRFHGLD